MSRVLVLREEFKAVADFLTPEFLAQPQPWHKLIKHSECWSLECQELLVSLVMELYPELCDGLDECMSSLVSPKLDPSMKLGTLKSTYRIMLSANVFSRFGWYLQNHACLSSFDVQRVRKTYILQCKLQMWASDIWISHPKTYVCGLGVAAQRLKQTNAICWFSHICDPRS